MKDDERMWEGKREILEEEVFYGGGKGKRDPRRKEKERIDQRKRGSGDQSKRKRNPWSKRTLKEEEGEGGLWEGRGGGFSRIKIIKASWTRVLFDDDD